MYSSENISDLKARVEVFIKDRGFELVEFKFYQRGRESYLNLFVDTPQGGITLAGCSALNREIRDFLDKNALVLEPYTLEVSSPGLDRSLASQKDFLRALNRKIKIFLKEPVNGRLEFAGKLLEASADKINLELDNSLIAAISLNNIAKAKNIV